MRLQVLAKLGAVAAAVLVFATAPVTVAQAARIPHVPNVPSIHDAPGNDPNAPNVPDPPNVPSTPTQPPATPTPSPTPTPTPAPTCHASSAGLPDATCTPGATNAQVTQQDIKSTICKKGWTKKVRPSETDTDNLKAQQMQAYGFTGAPSTYEEDHLIPLELGGAPTDSKNLWPEPGGLPSPNNKDKVEDAANRAVCSGKMPLTSAQQGMATNWIQLGRQLGGEVRRGGST